MLPQLLDPSEGILFCALVAAGFVGSFYLFPGALFASRNDPAVIRNRFKASLGSCVVSSVSMVLLLQYKGVIGYEVSILGLFHSLGFRFDGLMAALFLPLLLTAVIFFGPIMSEGLIHEALPFQPGFNSAFNIFALRTYVVGPIVEEIVFRMCMIPPLKASGFSNVAIIFGSPLFFGIAHLHHAWEAYRQGGSTPHALRQAVSSSIFQLAYTSVFGAYSAFLFLRTGHIAAPILCHMFCNYLGFPDFEAIRHDPKLKTALMACYVGGVAAFSFMLFPLTEPGMYHSVLW
ncbi:CAAX protease self-immunity-domain-containing protein [Polychytrium aggregatum]|uniref:CAAX protease self-immunity-domain-containing protein n=1 Tax=Polychytrium aggregatum TaxID=110093 RepID=UPI0022FDD98D|nr:CAAX protease self-immunity-domain-containing protein [Polychytrium aggregatum]KAI9206062.1 CAAX protease self-immunity-domain-containing protein [Polychytrium aggregatum]